MFSYKPLWITLIKQNKNKTELQELINCSSSTITKMGKNEYVAMSVLDKICNTLNCNIDDVIEHVKDEEKGV